MASGSAGGSTMAQMGVVMDMEANVTNFNRNIANATKTLGNFTSYTMSYGVAAQNANKSMNNTTKSMGGFKGMMASSIMRFAAYTLAIGAAMKATQMITQYVTESITKFREFQTTMAEVSTILDDQAMDSIPQLRVGVEQLSKAYGKSANDIGNALYEILSAAIAVEDSMYLLNVAVKASIAGLTDVKTAVDILTSIMNSYGNSVAQAARISDYLFQTVIRGKLHFEDFASSIGYISPIAANAGVAFKEIAAAMSTATRMGLHLDMTTRGLALGIQNIVSPSEGAAKAARKYGVEIGPLAFRLHGLTGIMQQLHDASIKYGKHIIGEIIPNMRSLRVYAALTSDVGLAGLIEDMDLLTGSTGATATAMEKMAETSQMTANILKEQLAFSARAVGEAWNEASLSFDRFKLSIIGGADAVATFDKRIREIKKHAIEGILTLGEEPKTTPFEGFMEQFKEGFKDPLPDIQKLVSEGINFENVLTHIADKEIQMGLAGDWLKKRKEIETAEQQLSDFNAAADETIEQQVTRGFTDLLLPGDKRYAPDVETKGIVEFEAEIAKLKSELALIDGDIENVGDALNLTADDFLGLKGFMESFNDTMDFTQTTINQLTITIGNLETEVGSLGNMLDGTLGEKLDKMIQEDVILDQLEAIDAGLAGNTEGYEYLTEEMQHHIDMVVADAKAMKKLDRAVQENNLNIMKIEYAGMKNRDRLSRGQQMRIKKLQMENAKARITKLEADLKADDTEVESSESVVEEQRRLLQIQLADLRDTRDADIADLEDTITAKEVLLDEAYQNKADQLGKLELLQEGYHTALVTMQTEFSVEQLDILEGFGIDIRADLLLTQKQAEATTAAIATSVGLGYTPEPSGGGGEGGGTTGGGGINQHYVTSIDGIMGPFQPPTLGGYKVSSSSGATKDFFYNTAAEASALTDIMYSPGTNIGWNRGTQSVPYTGLAMVHKGEQISPRGNDTGESINISINLGGVAINNEMDESHFSALLSNSVRRGLIDARTGQSKMRFR